MDDDQSQQQQRSNPPIGCQIVTNTNRCKLRNVLATIQKYFMIGFHTHFSHHSRRESYMHEIK